MKTKNHIQKLAARLTKNTEYVTSVSTNISASSTPGKGRGGVRGKK